METYTKNRLIFNALVAGWILAAIAFVALLMFIIPQYRVWSQGLSGQASLARATQERQIMVQQAQAELDAASLRAEAIAIVGEAAKQYPEYRQQEFIGAFGEAMMNGSIDKIIYVPTEANIPIIEAGRIGVRSSSGDN